MKKIALAVVLVASVIAAAALAAAEGRYDTIDSAFPQWFKAGIYVGQGASNPVGNTENSVKKMLGNSATIDFAARSAGTADSSGITVTGAAAGDPCFVGVPTSVNANAMFSCYVSAANTVKVRFTPTATEVGTITIGGGGTGTATVNSGTICVCSETSDATKTLKCAVSSTTLTATGTATDVIAYYCSDEVDPASGTYYVRVISSQ